jgi:uncharacterized membrane protein
MSPEPIQPTPPPMAPPPTVYAGPAPAQSQTSLWALITGIVGLLCGCFPVAIVAIVLGNKARKDPAENQGMANAGYVLGIIGVVLGVLGLIVYIVFMAVAVREGINATP